MIVLTTLILRARFFNRRAGAGHPAAREIESLCFLRRLAQAAIREEVGRFHAPAHSRDVSNP
jgi:hypothetical protein